MNIQARSVFVTGATGLIGSPTTRALRTNFASSSRKETKTTLAEYAETPMGRSPGLNWPAHSQAAERPGQSGASTPAAGGQRPAAPPRARAGRPEDDSQEDRGHAEAHRRLESGERLHSMRSRRPTRKCGAAPGDAGVVD